MTSASSKPSTLDQDNSVVTIDVSVQSDDGRASSSPPPPPPQKSGGLAISSQSQGNFSSFLAHITKDSFKKVVKEVEEKLEVVNETLGMLNNLMENQGFDAILDEMLRSIALKTGELLNADRTTIWLPDEEKDQLFTLEAKGENGKALEMRIPRKAGIVGEVATLGKQINIPFDFYNDSRSANAKKFDEQNNYRTYTMLTIPLFKEKSDVEKSDVEESDVLIAVVQLVNKLKKDSKPNAPLKDKIDQQGFTEEDETVFKEFAPSIRLILESSQSFYVATQKQRAASALMSAVSSLSQSSLDLEETLKRVMNEAKELMNADRSTLWLLDEEKDQIWTKIQLADGTLKEIRIPKSSGFAGIVVQSKEPLLIPFDAYNDERSKTARETDQKTGYRTCSLLCMPVFNADKKLIGVTQLINKKKPGECPPYDPETYPEAPEHWRASFTHSDQEFMEAFNIQAGVALQNAKLFETVKQQEQRQKDILRSLTNGVISTDKNGDIIAANESAKKLLGLDENEAIELKPLPSIMKLKKGQFDQWFKTTLHPGCEKDRQQYYPNQVLLSQNDTEQSINLTINSMTDVNDPDSVNGALVVMEDISDEMQIKNLMYKYMTPEVAESLLASGETGLGGKRKQVSVLFSDIRSYTTLTEKLQAEEVVTMLNAYFEEMVDAVFTFGGTLDKYIGDALMAVFGSPAPLEDHEWLAMQAAIDMRARLEKFNEARVKEGKLAISIGMGIHSDEVVSGNIGSSKRMELTSIGDGVNLASRLEGTSKQYGVDLVISEQTYHRYADRVIVRELDFITVKGKTQPVTIYELVALKEGPLAKPLSEKQEQSIELYRKGRELYLKTAREKLTGEELRALLERLEALPEAELKTLSYDDNELLAGMFGRMYLDELAKIVDPETLERLLDVQDLKDAVPSQAQDILPTKVSELTPREKKQLFAAKLAQFAGNAGDKKMLQAEAKDMSVDRIKKLIDLCKQPFTKKAKAAFKEATKKFQEVLKLDKSNKAAKLHVERCMLFVQSPPNEDWDGVWKLTDK
jgi:adenylate cyclase